MAAAALLKPPWNSFFYAKTYPSMHHLLEQYSDSAQDVHRSELFWSHRAIFWYEDRSTFLLLVGDYLTNE